MSEIKFEEALKKLEKIVEDLERGDLSLDDALKKYQDGIELSRVCAQRLDTAKKR
jgi:exodeoxyribonuclease VII small subunit